MTDRGPDVMTAEEAAEYLRVSLRTFKALRKLGEGPPGSKVGRQWRYRRTALDQWLAEREKAGEE
jgi:excisionase family DNA binding protein